MRYTQAPYWTASSPPTVDFFRGRGKKEAWSFFTKFTEAERKTKLMEKIEVDTVGQLQVFLLLKKADLLSYFEKLIGVGGDNLMQLSQISDDELVDIFTEIGMIDKPAHVLRFQRTLNEWNTNPQIFIDEMDNYEYCVNTMKIEKNFRKDFDNRIKQLCEDFCDQAEEREYACQLSSFS